MQTPTEVCRSLSIAEFLKTLTWCEFITGFGLNLGQTSWNVGRIMSELERHKIWMRLNMAQIFLCWYNHNPTKTDDDDDNSISPGEKMT